MLNLSASSLLLLFKLIWLWLLIIFIFVDDFIDLSFNTFISSLVEAVDDDVEWLLSNFIK